MCIKNSVDTFGQSVHKITVFCFIVRYKHGQKMDKKMGIFENLFKNPRDKRRSSWQWAMAGTERTSLQIQLDFLPCHALFIALAIFSRRLLPNL